MNTIRIRNEKKGNNSPFVLKYTLSVLGILGFLVLCIERKVAGDELLELYESSDNGSYLDAGDQTTLHNLKRLEERKLKPNTFVPGEVQFTFGSGVPTIVCAIMELSDIALETNERVLDIKMGDTARWSLDTATSGSEYGLVEHLIIKPLDSGLKTSLIVTTNRRTYHIKLKSTLKDYMPQVVFTYPNTGINLNRRITDTDNYYVKEPYYPHEPNLEDDNMQTIALRASSKKDIPQNGNAVRNYNYHVEGADCVLPVNVFDDGSKTYIQMDDKKLEQEMPTVLEITYKDGFIFDDEKTTTVNFRIDDSTFVIDGIYKHLRVQSNNGGLNSYADVTRIES